MTRSVAVVPHVHWDREWYSSFQAFRLRLVELLDGLLALLEGDPSFSHFLLDGQMAVVDDYLAVRPEAGERLRRLNTAGRVAMGPWYVLMDEFCVSGETIVRNLQLGLARAADFGGAMEVGYLPDMFGHVAQMPQLLRLAGFSHAVVWRGVPRAVDRTGFWWRAPDGSTVRAEYLPVGYGNGAVLPEAADALLRRVRAHEQELRSLLLDGILLMNGSDHEVPQPWLGALVAAANAAQGDYRFHVTSLAAHLRTAPVEGLPSWTGELRSGARANLLMGVASNRVDVKQAAARGERSLERLAEPLSALFLPPQDWPGTLLALAWHELIRNSAHDSICACSVDAVVDAVLQRYTEATDIADGLTRSALRRFAASLRTSGAVVVNPSPRARSGTVEIVAAAGPPPPGVQLLAEGRRSVVERAGVGRDLEALLGEVHTRNAATGTEIIAVDIGGHHGVEGPDTGPEPEPDAGLHVTVTTGLALERDQRVRASLAELFARAGAEPEAPLRVHTDHGPPTRFLARVDDIEGFGWATWAPEPLRAEPVMAHGTVLENGLVRVEVDPEDGTFSIDGLAGFDRLVDDGDHGDTYNYSPPATDVVVDRPQSVDVTIVDEGPIRGRLRVTRNFRWPASVVDGARRGEVEVEVSTQLELHAGERLVRITTTLDNRCRDHRLRSWLPLPEPARRSQAECAFGVVERGLEAEGGAHERALPTFPSRRFVRAGGLTVVHEGLLEYELVDGGRALALTLLRATGMLSRDGMRYRPRPAGPALPVAGAQMPGRQVVRYGVALGDTDPYALVDDAFLPLFVVPAAGGGQRPSRGSALRIEGAEVSAVRRTSEGELEVRLFNPTPDHRRVVLHERRGRVVDLRGRATGRFDQEIAVGPHEIVTVRVDEDG